MFLPVRIRKATKNVSVNFLFAVLFRAAISVNSISEFREIFGVSVNVHVGEQSQSFWLTHLDAIKINIRYTIRIEFIWNSKENPPCAQKHIQRLYINFDTLTNSIIMYYETA